MAYGTMVESQISTQCAHCGGKLRKNSVLLRGERTEFVACSKCFKRPTPKPVHPLLSALRIVRQEWEQEGSRAN